MDWIVRNMLAFIVLVALTRLLVRRRFAKTTVLEIFLANTIGDLAAHAAFERQHSLLAGLGSITLWVAAAVLLHLLASRWNWFERLLFGQSVEVVKAGAIDTAALHRLQISLSELESELRKQGVRELGQVQSASVEPDGAVAVERADSVAQELRPR